MQNKQYYSNGKLLLTGEYLVLKGAKAIALPSLFGQLMTVSQNNSQKIEWTSYDSDQKIWFQQYFKLSDIVENNATPYSQNDIAQNVFSIFCEVQKQNPMFFNRLKGCCIETRLTFPKNWGLGTSSTLINNISQWTNVNPYKLNFNIFKGSGYDIACGNAKGAVLFRIENEKPHITPLDFIPNFKEHLYFIHLNKKQNSRNEIKRFNVLANKIDMKSAVSDANHITESIISCHKLNDFEYLIKEHEKLISSLIACPSIKERMFKDFEGEVKSLGAWGGDFVLATGDAVYIREYFTKKGFSTIVKYDEMAYI